MTNQPQGRKKHLVDGEVAEIERKGEGLGLGKVSKGDSFLSSLLKNIKGTKKEKKENTNEKRKF